MAMYKNADEFAAAHGAQAENKDVTLGEIADDLLDEVDERIKEGIQEWLEPGEYYREKDPVKIEARRRWDEQDANRPDIKSLKFTPVPKEKGAGLKAKFGLFAGDWNKFIAEVEAGNAEIAEVLYLDFFDIKFAASAMDQELYCKVADLDGHVIKGCVRRINNIAGVDDREMGGWLSPSVYYQKYMGRTDEEYAEYSKLYWENNQQDPVDPSDRKHAYVLHYRTGNKEYYGLITFDEYEDLKKIKDKIGYPWEYSLKTSNNTTPEFSW